MRHANSLNGCSQWLQSDSRNVTYEQLSLSMALITFRAKSGDLFVLYSWNCRTRKRFQMEWFFYSEVRHSLFQTSLSLYAAKPAWKTGPFEWSLCHAKLFIDLLMMPVSRVTSIEI